MFENVDIRTDDRGKLYYKVTYEPKGSGELKQKLQLMSETCKRTRDSLAHLSRKLTR